MPTKSELYQEARRCADRASRGVSPAMDNMFGGLARFYSSLADTEADERSAPGKPPEKPQPRMTDHHRPRP